MTAFLFTADLIALGLMSWALLVVRQSLRGRREMHARYLRLLDRASDLNVALIVRGIDDPAMEAYRRYLRDL